MWFTCFCSIVTNRFIACWPRYNMGCSCPLCPHEYVTECESAYCNCCSKSQHKLGSLIKNEKELSELLETKYNFGWLQSFSRSSVKSPKKIRVLKNPYWLHSSKQHLPCEDSSKGWLMRLVLQSWRSFAILLPQLLLISDIVRAKEGGTVSDIIL